MLSFVGAALILIIIPGPDQAMMTRNALGGGRAGGFLTMLGGALGLSVHATLASVGISALVLGSPTAFTVLKVAGTVYLLWMGVQTIRSARRTRRLAADGTSSDPIVQAPLRYVRQGFLSNSLNPKVALFFIAFLPQFLPANTNPLREALLFSAIFALLYVAWFSLYVVTVQMIGTVLRRPSVRAWIEQVTGVLLIGFGIRLILES